MSAIDLCNEALGLIGKGEINSLKDPEPNARYCNRFYAVVVKELQSRYPWQFNLSVTDISAQTTPSGVPGYLYAHNLPPEYLRFACLNLVDPATATNKEVMHSLETDNMTIQGDQIHTNFTPIKLTFNKYQPDTTKFPEPVRNCVSVYLASKIVFPLTRDRRLTADIRTEASVTIALAQQDEDRDEYTEAPQVSSFVNARG